MERCRHPVPMLAFGGMSRLKLHHSLNQAITCMQQELIAIANSSTIAKQHSTLAGLAFASNQSLENDQKYK
jgi:hypothetical protein